MGVKIGRGDLKNLQEIIALCNLVFRPKEKSMGIETPLMWDEDNVEAGNLFIVKEDGRIVSFVGMIEREVNVFGYRIKIGNIGNVCTHPDYRKKGYASTLLQEAIKKAWSDNLSYLMISGTAGIYKKAGAVSMLYYLYEFPGNEEKPKDFKIVRYKDTMYKECISIYQGEKVRFIRTKDYSRVFSLYNGKFIKKVMRMRTKVWVIMKKNKVLGYWTEGEKGDKISCANGEYAGLREIIIKMLKRKKKKVEFYLPIWDKEIKTYLGKEKEIKERGTILLINPKLLFDNLRGFFTERGAKVEIVQKNEEYLLTVNGKRKKFKNKVDLSNFIFTLKEEEPWKDVFPIPFPVYGFDYA